MNIYENFTNMYQVNKTIRMGLKPICKTDENIAKFLEEDKERSEKYKIAKKIIDKENRAFIEDRLKDFSISGLDEYLELLKQKKDITKIQKKMRDEISKQLKGFPQFDSKWNPDSGADDHLSVKTISKRTDQTFGRSTPLHHW